MSSASSPSILSVKFGADYGGMLFFYFCLIIGFIITFRSIYPGVCQSLSASLTF